MSIRSVRYRGSRGSIIRSVVFFFIFFFFVYPSILYASRLINYVIVVMLKTFIFIIDVGQNSPPSPTKTVNMPLLFVKRTIILITYHPWTNNRYNNSWSSNRKPNVGLPLPKACERCCDRSPTAELFNYTHCFVSYSLENDILYSVD